MCFVHVLHILKLLSYHSTRLVVCIVVLLWNLTGLLAEIWMRHLPIIRAIGQFSSLSFVVFIAQQANIVLTWRVPEASFQYIGKRCNDKNEWYHIITGECFIRASTVIIKINIKGECKWLVKLIKFAPTSVAVYQITESLIDIIEAVGALQNCSDVI